MQREMYILIFSRLNEQQTWQLAGTTGYNLEICGLNHFFSPHRSDARNLVLGFLQPVDFSNFLLWRIPCREMEAVPLKNQQKIYISAPSTVKSLLSYAPKIEKKKKQFLVKPTHGSETFTVSWSFVSAWTKKKNQKTKKHHQCWTGPGQPACQRAHGRSQDAQNCINPY